MTVLHGWDGNDVTGALWSHGTIFVHVVHQWPKCHYASHDCCMTLSPTTRVTGVYLAFTCGLEIFTAHMPSGHYHVVRDHQWSRPPVLVDQVQNCTWPYAPIPSCAVGFRRSTRNCTLVGHSVCDQDNVVVHYRIPTTKLKACLKRRRK